MLFRHKKLVFVLATAATFATQTLAQSAAQTPPMGWNSWDAYGLTITESQFRDDVLAVKAKLLPFGWNYAVVDEGWFFENPDDRPHPEKLRYALDAHGRYVPVPARFPSSVEPDKAGSRTRVEYPGAKLNVAPEETSFRQLGDWVHAQGMKFGIHIVRGIPRAAVERRLPIDGSSYTVADAADTSDACPWDPTNWGVKDNAAGQAWYDSVIRQYAGWGVDLLKVDCISDHPYKLSEIQQIRRAIDKTGRPMVLSLSPGPTALSHASEVASLANMWRISDDFWDVWPPEQDKQFPQSLKGQFDRLAQWAAVDLKPGQWPDADMLPLGELRPAPGWGKPRATRFTPDEQRTLITLWAMVQSPLILGANPSLLDDATLKLLTNREVIRIDQQAAVRGAPLPAFRDGDLRVWHAELHTASGGHRSVAALFNLGDTPRAVDYSVEELGLAKDRGRERAGVFDVWEGKSLGRVKRVKLTIPAHGVVLLERRPPQHVGFD